MSVLSNSSKLGRFAEEVRPSDGPTRRHDEHALSVAERRRADQRFESRIAPPGSDDDPDGEPVIAFEPAGPECDRMIRSTGWLPRGVVTPDIDALSTGDMAAYLASDPQGFIAEATEAYGVPFHTAKRRRR